MREVLQSAYILHHRSYSENSLILDVFSQNQGRVSLIARGVKKNQSRVYLQPFVPLSLSWQGKTELMSLTYFEPQNVLPLLQGEALLAAFYLNELLVYLLPKWDPHPTLYTNYQHTLLQLQTSRLQPQTSNTDPATAIETALRYFEKDFLEELGYGLNIKDNIDPNAFYRYYPEQGFIPCEPDFKSNWVFPGKSLIGLAAKNLSDNNMLKDAKRLMRMVFKPLLGNKLLHSRKLYEK